MGIMGGGYTRGGYTRWSRHTRSGYTYDLLQLYDCFHHIGNKCSRVHLSVVCHQRGGYTRGGYTSGVGIHMNDCSYIITFTMLVINFKITSWYGLFH